MKGKVVSPIGGTDIQVYSCVSFNCNQTMPVGNIQVFQNGNRYNLPLGCIEALEAENLEDVEYLDRISKTLEEHQSLLVFTSGGTALGYVFEDELTTKGLPSILDFAPREIANRKLYKQLVLKMAVEDGLKVYSVNRFNAVQRSLLRVGHDANRFIGRYNNIDAVISAFQQMKEKNEWL